MGEAGREDTEAGRVRNAAGGGGRRKDARGTRAQGRACLEVEVKTGGQVEQTQVGGFGKERGEFLFFWLFLAPPRYRK